jgi:hypothetical protein
MGTELEICSRVCFGRHEEMRGYYIAGCSSGVGARGGLGARQGRAGQVGDRAFAVGRCFAWLSCGGRFWIVPAVVLTKTCPGLSGHGQGGVPFSVSPHAL